MAINIPETGQKRIVVIGAGFAGLTFVEKMLKSDYQLVLLDKNNYHQFQPLFYQVAMSGLEPSSIAFPLRKAFQGKKNLFIRVAEVDQVDVEKKILLTSLGYIDYDILVLATGASTNYFGNDVLKEKTYSLKTVSESLALRNAILIDYEEAVITRNYDKRQGLIDIVIVGGGPTGVELAGALAEMRSHVLPKDYHELDNKEVDIYLIQSGNRLLPGMSEKASSAAEKYLKDLDVQVMLDTRVTDYDGEYVTTRDGHKILTEKVIWAAGITANKISGIEQKEQARGNRYKVDNFNKLDGFENIYVLGDLAYMTTDEYPDGHPQVAQTAIQQAKNLAYNIRNSRNRVFKYNDKGSMATIGRNKAVVDLPSFTFTGFFAWFTWLFVHLFALIGVKNRVFVFINWVWNYFTYDQSLRIILKAEEPKDGMKVKNKE
jgi:NADH dehydrogenase